MLWEWFIIEEGLWWKDTWLSKRPLRDDWLRHFTCGNQRFTCSKFRHQLFLVNRLQAHPTDLLMKWLFNPSPLRWFYRPFTTAIDVIFELSPLLGGHSCASIVPMPHWHRVNKWTKGPASLNTCVYEVVLVGFFFTPWWHDYSQCHQNHTKII